MDCFDYIVIGGGTAGSVLAARLSEDGSRTVLLIEAGPLAGSPALADPAAWPSLWPGAADWGYSTTSQPGLANTSLLFPRGKVLGGSSGINGMIHIRGERANFAGWRARGAAGWGYEDVLPYFMRSETVPGGAADRGDSGPMGPAPAPPDSAFSRAAVQAMQDDPRVLHAGFHDLNIVGGRRQSAADAYLTREVQQRPNLHIWPAAHAHRLVLKGGRATSVVVQMDGEVRVPQAGDEIVLTAGTVGTPHLLMLSGIGPARHLHAHAIPVQVDLPGVGENLQDHPLAAVVYDEGTEQTTSAYQYAEVTALLQVEPTALEPDVQLLLVSRGFDAPNLPVPLTGSLLAVGLVTPRSRGTIRLGGPSPQTRPLIDPAYLTDPRDGERLLQGVRAARDIMRSPRLDRWRGVELLPGQAVGDDDLRGYLRHGTGSYWHPVGTARLGPDSEPAAVVDLELRVRGVHGLRVADASVMPTIVSANTNATVLAIAERAADLIRHPVAETHRHGLLTGTPA